MGMPLKKITAEEIGALGVVAAPDVLAGTPTENKAIFDRLVRELVAGTYNGLLDALEAKTGAAQLGAEAFEQVAGETVQQQIRDVQGNVEALRAHEGAGKIGAEPVGRLLGETVAAQLGELLAIHEGLRQAGGAAFVGAEPFLGANSHTVQGQLRDIQQNVNDINEGVIPSGSVTKSKLAQEVVDWVDAPVLVDGDTLEEAFGKKVPTLRTVNGKALAEDIVLTAEDVGISAETAEFLGMDPAAGPTVNDAFVASVLASKNACLVQMSVTLGGKPAKENLQINGLTDLTGGPLYTRPDGTAIGLATTASTTISVSVYVDLPPVSKTIATPLKTIVSATLALSAPVPGEKSVTTSTGGFRFSPYTTAVDVCCVGGGWAGSNGQYSADDEGYYTYRSGGTGGSGGGVRNVLQIRPDTKLEYPAIVGAAGIASPSSSPGESSFMGATSANGTKIPGGQGAYYRYSMGTVTRGTVVDGGKGTTKYGDASGTRYGDSGGGGGNYDYNAGGKVSYPGGGSGGYYNSGGGTATGYGGGGGGGGQPQNTSVQTPPRPGDGYQGIVCFRWRVAT